MLDYLLKFNSLPKEVKEIVSSPKNLALIKDLENRYQLDLSQIIIKVLVEEIKISELESFLANNSRLDSLLAEDLVFELKEKIFKEAAKYLNWTELSNLENKEEKEKISLPPVKEILPKQKIAPVVNSAPEAKTAPTPVKAKPVPAASLAELPNKVKKEDRVDYERADYFFFPEDEEDMKVLAKKAEELSKLNKTQPIENDIDIIVKEVDIVFSSQQLSDRFINILRAFLKGVRDRIETKQTIIRNVDSGGLGMDEALADKILQVAQKQLHLENKENLIVKPKSFVVKEDSSLPLPKTEDREEKKTLNDWQKYTARDFEYDLAGELAKKEKQQNLNKKNEPKTENKTPAPKEKVDLSQVIVSDEEELKKETSKQEILPLPKLMIKPEEKVKIKTPITKPVEKVLDKEKEAEKNSSLTNETEALGSIMKETKSTTDININDKQNKFRSPSVMSGKKLISDVQPAPRVMDAIAELQYLDLINYRRLAEEPIERSKKIVEKINILERERYARRMEGIKAWRQSPINRLYLLMGQESISQSKGIDVIIKQRQKIKKDFLVRKEFDAIGSLNKYLRY